MPTKPGLVALDESSGCEVTEPRDDPARDEQRRIERASQGLFSAGDVVSFGLAPSGIFGWLMLEDADPGRSSRLLQASVGERSCYWPKSRYGPSTPVFLLPADRFMGGADTEDLVLGPDVELGPLVVRRTVMLFVPTFALSAATYVGSLPLSVVAEASRGVTWPRLDRQRICSNVEITRWNRTLVEIATDLTARLLAH